MGSQAGVKGRDQELVAYKDRVKNMDRSRERNRETLEKAEIGSRGLERGVGRRKRWRDACYNYLQSIGMTFSVVT